MIAHRQPARIGIPQLNLWLNGRRLGA